MKTEVEETVVPAESTTEVVETEQDAASAAAEPEPEVDPSPDEQPPKKKGSNMQRRFNELSRDVHLAKAEAEFWRTKALGSTPEKAPVETPKGKPNPADFENTEAYLDARDEWVRQDTLRVTREEIQKTEQQREQRTEQEVLADEWSEKEASFTGKHPDYSEVTSEAMETLQRAKGPAQSAIAHAVQYSEIGPQLLYHLGQHPEEVQKIAAMHPTQAALALGRIEARLIPATGGETEPLPPTTKAPKPQTPLKKTSGSAEAEPDDASSDKALSDEEWVKRRNAQVRKRGGR